MLFGAAHEGALGRLSGERDSSLRSEYSPNASVTGLCTLVQTAAAELRDNGVTVNALLPITIDTPQVRSWYGDAEAHKWVDPRSLGSLLLWLASEPGRDVTGAIIPVVGRQNHPCFQ